MFALDVMAAAAVSDRADQDCLPGAIVILGMALGLLDLGVPFQAQQIENGGSEVGDFPPLLMRHVAGHGERLEVYLGTHDGRPEVKHYPAFEVLDALAVDQKIAIARATERRAV